MINRNVFCNRAGGLSLISWKLAKSLQWLHINSHCWLLYPLYRQFIHTHWKRRIMSLLLGKATGCFLKILKYFGLWPFSVFPRCHSVCTHTGEVEHQHCSTTARVPKIKKMLRENTIFYEHLVFHFIFDIPWFVYSSNSFPFPLNSPSIKLFPVEP